MIKNYLTDKSEMVEKALADCLKLDISAPKAGIIFDAMNYSLLAGGKRLRPILFLETLECFGLPSHEYMPFACGLEMIHTCSLIHDDLPAMDNDDLRRGKPTCHKQFGDAMAILAGDGLLTHSFSKMLEISSIVPGDRLIKAVNQVSLSAGLQGMVTGQAIDIAHEGDANLDLPTLKQIHFYKTGALFSCAILCGGILADATPEEMKALEAYSYNFGLAFQIIDDILDVIGDEKKLGKHVGSDAKNCKITYVELIGLEESKKRAKEASDLSIAALESFGERGTRLQEIAAYFLSRQY